MCQVNGRWSFSATWGSETPEPIHLKSGMCYYVHSPTTHAKYGGRRKWGVGKHMGEVAPSRAFFNFFLVPSMRPQLTLTSVDFRSVHPKTCFGGGCVPLGSICPGGQIFPFFANRNHFSMVRKRLWRFWDPLNIYGTV